MLTTRMSWVVAHASNENSEPSFAFIKPGISKKKLTLNTRTSYLQGPKRAALAMHNMRTAFDTLNVWSKRFNSGSQTVVTFKVGQKHLPNASYHEKNSPWYIENAF